MNMIVEFESTSYNFLLKRIDEIQSLKENWNGYGTNSIPFSAIKRAKTFIFLLRDLSEFLYIYPTARESIQIEFEKDDIYFEAEIYTNYIDIYAERNSIEYKNEQFDSIENAVSSFRNLFNETKNGTKSI